MTIDEAARAGQQGVGQQGLGQPGFGTTGYETDAAVPAGWYPDPSEPGSARWWDGSAWTEHARPIPAAEAAPIGRPVTGAPAPSWQQVTPVEAPGWSARPTVPSANTVGVWLLACVPVMIWISTFLGGVVAALLGAPSSFGVLAVLPVIVAEWVFAYLDARALAARGFRRPSILWMLLLPPLCYLIARGRAVRASGATGWPPEAVFFAQWFLGFLVNLGLTGLLSGTHL